MTDLVPHKLNQQAALAQPAPLSENPAAVYLASLGSDASRRTMRAALDTMAGLMTGGQADALTMPWHLLRYQHTQALRSQLAARYAHSTANKHLSALRRVLKEAWRLGLMDSDDYRQAADIENVKGETVPAGRALTSGEIAALLNDCAGDTSPNGARDAAIIGLLYGCGLRRAEIVALDLDDYDPDSGRLVVRGKRNKERTVYVRNGAAAALADWLAIRGESVEDTPALFLPTRKGGHIVTRQGSAPARLTTQAVYKLLQKRADRAGVPAFSPHDMRRTFISDLLDRGADIVTVQKLAGHASPNTTARYDRRPEEAKRRAQELLHVPYAKRLT